MARYRGADPDDVVDLKGEWHVGRHFIGMFPAIELTCPCPKARCGLAVPVADIYCEQHHGTQTLRQIHHVDDCATHARRHRRAR